MKDNIESDELTPFAIFNGSLELARKGDRLELETYNGTATYPNGETVKTSGILEANYANTDSERR